MKCQPLISIITVVYNGEKYLEQTITSVIKQTYKNLEYIIIDGGSTDSTLGIIKKYEKQIACWVSEQDKGLYDAMNKGIKLAKGELIGMINSDDWYELNAVEIVVNAYLQNPDKRIFHGNRFDIHSDGSNLLREFHPSRLKFLYYGMTYNHPSMFIHKKIYELRAYNINLKSLSDYEFVLKHYLENKDNFFYIPQAYVNYRLDGISAQMNLFDQLKEGFNARRNAGLNIVENRISFLFRGLLFSISKLFRSSQ